MKAYTTTRARVPYTELDRVIRELIEERDRLTGIIAILEGIATKGKGSAGTRDPRGRKGMNDQQRKEVAVRMKNYWDKRRAQKAAATPHARKPLNGAIPAPATMTATAGF